MLAVLVVAPSACVSRPPAHDALSAPARLDAAALDAVFRPGARFAGTGPDGKPWRLSFDAGGAASAIWPEAGFAATGTWRRDGDALCITYAEFSVGERCFRFAAEGSGYRAFNVPTGEPSGLYVPVGR